MRTSQDVKFFAKLERRLVKPTCCVAVATVIKSQYGFYDEVDVVLCRIRRREIAKAVFQEAFEIIRFLPEDKELAYKFFPYGPPFLNSGPAWRETTNWLARVVNSDRPIRELEFVRIEEYPQKALPPHFNLKVFYNAPALS